ncbi:UDP-glucose/GDP-mannose dehydrogenase family protein [Candidatus Uhrbacteria bacterium]|nr:UDP-glucose/GDP-mannose dehydrogenase family protein [Candidatus Uhrbacteria bacterium]
MALIGIVGSAGMVGGAIKRYFEKRGVQPFCFDKYKNEGSLEEVNRADIVFICVPTPYDEANGGFDLSYVKAAIGALTGEKIVVIKSTVLPGTTDVLQEEFPQHKFLFNPEFLTQSSADNDMSFPDRQIVGYTAKSYNAAGTLIAILPLAPFERVVPAKEAEMIKYFGNTWFSAKVVFANQMYDLCVGAGVDYNIVKECVAADKRIGPSHLEIFHGGYRGYGGACLPKDTRALIQYGESIGVQMDLLKKAEEINNKLRAKEAIAPGAPARPQTTDNKSYAPPLAPFHGEGVGFSV